MSALHSACQNQILAALLETNYDNLSHHLERVKLCLGEVLYEAGDKLHYAYFPTNCIISLLYVLATSHSTEIAVAGNEGILGIALFMGGKTMPNRIFVITDALHILRTNDSLLDSPVSTKPGNFLVTSTLIR